MNIEYTTFKDRLLELCDELVFDEGGQDERIYEGGNQNRTGIFYRGEHLCNVDRGVVTEWEVVEDFLEPVIERISPHEALSNPLDEKITTHQDLFHPRGDCFQQQCFLDLNRKLGKRLHGEVKFGSGQSMARRMDVQLKNGETVPGILVYIYVREEMKKTSIARIGWRHAFEYLLAHKIPGITREAIEEAFDVDITNFKPEDGPNIEKLYSGEIKE